MLGHRDLPDFVGDIDAQAPYRRSDGVSPETMIGSLGVALFVILEGTWAVVAAVALGRRLLGCGRTA
jgi:hypothetical protein